MLILYNIKIVFVFVLFLYNYHMQKPTITGQIYTKILEILENNPEGIHWSEL